MTENNSNKGILIGLVVLIAAIIGIVALVQSDPEPLQTPTNSEVTTEPVELVNGVYTVDPTASQIEWEATKIGGGHDGLVAVSSGMVVIENDRLVSGEVVVDMTTIETVDNGEGNDAVDEHLSSDDFFAVETYPTATLTLDSVEVLGGNEYQLSGNLEIRGMTESVSFPATVVTEGDQLLVDATVEVDRDTYDIGTASTLADIGLGDTFDLRVTLVADLDQA